MSSASLAEAWRLVVRNISNLVPAGYQVRVEPEAIDFSQFKNRQGRMHVRIERQGNRIFIVVGRNMECTVIRLGNSIGNLESEIVRYLVGEFRNREER